MQLTRVFALAGLTVSVLLLGHHTGDGLPLCPFDSGCDRVLSSRFSRPGGVPLPLFGAFGFALLFAASLLQARWLRPLALAAGVAGLGLILLQTVILHDVCPYCMVADLSAMGVALTQLRRRETPPLGRRPRIVWLVSAGLVVGVAVLLGPVAAYLEERERRVPAQVKALWVPDKVNIVEVADFQC